jgi:hypothetical protein
MASNLGNYRLPVIEGMPGEYVVHEMPLPRFAAFKFPEYTFLPDRKSDLGVHTIKGKLWNAHTFLDFQFRLNVSNEAPQFTGGKLKEEIVVALDTVELYVLPTAKDREGQTVTYSTFESKKSTLPAFVTFNSTSLVYTIAPTYQDIAGKYMIQVEV